MTLSNDRFSFQLWFAIKTFIVFCSTIPVQSRSSAVWMDPLSGAISRHSHTHMLTSQPPSQTEVHPVNIYMYMYIYIYFFLGGGTQTNLISNTEVHLAILLYKSTQVALILLAMDRIVYGLYFWKIYMRWTQTQS